MNPTDFASLSLSQDLLTVVQELGFEKLTPIQAQSIPLLLEGKDLVGQSRTGSGKTAAFALPILEKTDLDEREIQSLILCPTRELCEQVAREIRRLGRRHPRLQVLVLCGGQPIRPQIHALQAGVHIIVGTPGRVLDHIRRETLNLMSLKTLVLDEADRMLDMGFEEDMKIIMDEIPLNRQTVFFSATFRQSIQSLSRKYQRRPVQIKVQEAPETTPSIRQLVYDAEAEEKFEALLKLLLWFQPEAAIVFCNQKLAAIELALSLEKRGVSCSALHGDLEQKDRNQVMAMFRNGSIRVLTATDVAARGLDIESLDMVINFDLPHQVDVYVHRIGRTGRAGQTGIAVSLATSQERLRLYDFEKQTGVSLTPASSEVGRESRPGRSSGHRQAKMRTLYISGGRKDKIRPGDILGALTGEAGRLEAAKIGKIEIHDNFSYVAVSQDIAEMAVQRLRSGRIKGRRFLVKTITARIG